MPKRPRPKAKPANINALATQQANRAAFDNLRNTPQYGGGPGATKKRATKKAPARSSTRTTTRSAAPARKPGPSAKQRYERMMRNIQK